MAAPVSARKRSRRGGRPTLEEAAQLDHDVREHALDLFLERGYEGTSMDAIAHAAGTTKASLYVRFPSKEAVFQDVLVWASRRSDWPMPEPDPPDLDELEDALSFIAHAAVRRALDPSMIKLSRIAVAQAHRFPELVRKTQAAIVWPRQQVVASLLRRHAAAGTIVADDPELLAELFLGLVAGVPARLASFGTVRDAAAQEQHTQAALWMFLRGLRP